MLAANRHRKIKIEQLGPLRSLADATALIRLVPLGRYPRLDEIAEAAIMLASGALDCANGHTITLDGGLTVQLRPVDVERAPA
ncbi:NAD(P)-dependent dehydrogenase (short-subunit alcohol dehydrogenase family) [Allocatelliglobosispora scoriae]|uniref:NAD(P)-dependent dehydrogenase (Short-subunit alcohol dehydrogenase family) n=1 Tax=Allocatelliglobosispora scoriae TaxID=643052 RepID=A0A841C766_9ACTN|nr:hypothetical protein [Allocatelliglobosispora scoriae]MBB5874631.1 NAD(P)-dependent dehydrogenase (short-subunit alcohol dehydrogenase family) [Allocatelliglobosispora scoriae]